MKNIQISATCTGISKACSFLLAFLFIPASYSQKISEHVRFNPGPVNSVIINKNGRNLVVYGDPANKLSKADMVLFTHFRRDVTWAGKNLVQNGSPAVAPYEERSYFLKGDSLWSAFAVRRFHDYQNQTTKFGMQPLKISRFVNGGETLRWQDISIKVIKTPGYTRGSVSYLADIDGKRLAFTGDLIYGDGKVFDLYSLQDSVKKVDGYHGYAVRLGQLVSSLRLLESERPDLIIPARGPVITNPDSSIAKLIRRVQLLYSNYLSITANRWNHQDRMENLTHHVLGPSGVVDWMPQAVLIKDTPSWYTHINISNLITAGDGSAFLIDCGSKSTFERLVKMRQTGNLKSIDGIFITHYHDDHTEFINDVVKEFGCPVYVTKELQDIIQNPGGFHMPCLTAKPVVGLTIVKDRQKMKWKDFNFTFFYFPGQTLYHDALMVEKDKGETVFFIGDSFTPCGIDDYCLLNRNFLHPGTGYFYCLDILRKLPENILLSNQHIEPLFKFSREQTDLMIKLLNRRNEVLGELLPWDNINYGTDEQWAGIYPYSQKANPSESIEYSVKIFNHSDTRKTFFIEPDVPAEFIIEPKSAFKTIDSKTVGDQVFRVKAPGNKKTAPSLLTVSIKFDNLELHEWCEALIE